MADLSAPMKPLVSVVGNSGVGKTTFLERLIRELKTRGYRVATIKHDVHTFEIDHPGKDSWRLAKAGSDIVVISGSSKLALIERVRQERALTDVVAMISDRVDIVLTEGYRGASAMKIEVSRSEHSHVLTARLDDLIAIVTDERFDYPVPQFDLGDGPGVADLLEGRFALRSPHSAPGVKACGSDAE
ncbi:MAG: molybdopterin-guanine dinucleotide biosynthesis protein B [Dehalococcoidia bacterium]